MKKTQMALALTLAVSMAATLVGCGAVKNKPSAAAGSASASTASTDGGSSNAEIKIIMGHEGNDDLSDGIFALKFNELIEEKSGGRITVDYKSNGTLGDEDELLQQVMQGSIQAT